ncbi:MAG: hypothetical protein Q4Q26_05330 [Eubacteriales bacterium]|nr:hypothetical protein [Eubacteriales bacterium]
MESRKMKVNITLELHEDDLKAILYRLAADGTDMTELLEGFISDLVCGKNRHGSDECDRAKAYYDRCLYGFFEEDTFLRYLLESGEMEYFLSVLEDVEAYREWSNDGEDYKEELKEAEEAKNRFYNEWAESHKTPPQNRGEAFEQVEKWHKEYEKFMDGCEIAESEGKI